MDLDEWEESYELDSEIDYDDWWSSEESIEEDELIDPHSLRLTLSEPVRWSSQVRMLISYDFRIECGMLSIEKWGYFIERNMSNIIGKYSDWVEWPEGEITFTDDASEVLAFALSDRGQYLFTSLSDNQIIKWDLTSLSIVNEWESGHRAQLLACKAGLLASVSRKRIRVWNSYNCGLLMSFSLPKVEVWYEYEYRRMRVNPDSVDFSESGDQILVAIRDTEVMVFSVHTGELMFQIDCSGRNRCARFFREYIIALDSFGWLQLRNAVDGWGVSHERRYSTIDFADDFKDSSINSDSTLIACLVSDEVRIVSFEVSMEDGATCPVFRDTYYCIDAKVQCLCFHPSKPNIMAIIDDVDSSVHIFDVRRSHSVRTSPRTTPDLDDMDDCDRCRYLDIQFSPDGHYVIMIESQGRFVIRKSGLD